MKIKMNTRGWRRGSLRPASHTLLASMHLTSLPPELFSDIVSHLTSFIDLFHLILTGDARLKWANCLRLRFADDLGFSFRWPFHLLQFFPRLEHFDISSSGGLVHRRTGPFEFSGLPTTLRRLSATLPTIASFRFPISRLKDFPNLEVFNIYTLFVDIDPKGLSLPPKLKVFQATQARCAPTALSSSLLDLLCILPQELEVFHIAENFLPGTADPNRATEWRWPQNLQSLLLNLPCDSLDILHRLPPSLTEFRAKIQQVYFPRTRRRYCLDAKVWDALPEGLQVFELSNSTWVPVALPMPSQLRRLCNLRIFKCWAVHLEVGTAETDAPHSRAFTWDTLPPRLEFFRLEASNRICIIPSSTQSSGMPPTLTRIPAYFLPKLSSSLIATLLDLPVSMKILPNFDVSNVNIFEMLDEIKSRAKEEPRTIPETSPSSSSYDIHGQDNGTSELTQQRKKRMPQLLPPNLEQLSLTSSDDCSLFFDLPSTHLRHLSIHSIAIPSIIPTLPNTLVHLACNQYTLPLGVKSLPPTLTRLSIIWSGEFTYPLTLDAVDDGEQVGSNSSGSTDCKLSATEDLERRRQRRDFFLSGPPSLLPPTLTSLSLEFFELSNASKAWIGAISGTLPLQKLVLTPSTEILIHEPHEIVQFPLPTQFSESLTMRELQIGLCWTHPQELKHLPKKLSTLKVVFYEPPAPFEEQHLRLLPTTLCTLSIYPEPCIPTEAWEMAHLPHAEGMDSRQVIVQSDTPISVGQ